MTKQEAIEILNKNAPKSDPRLCALELCSAIYVVTKALQEPERKWIPVSERLPAEEGRYLCAYGKNEMNVYPFSNDLYSVDDYDFAEYKFEKKKGFYTDYSEWGYCEANFIKAWQPLPEAYKESEEE